MGALSQGKSIIKWYQLCNDNLSAIEMQRQGPSFNVHALHEGSARVLIQNKVCHVALKVIHRIQQ